MKMFTMHHAKRHYLTHPRAFIRHIAQNLRYAKQRVFRGWDDMESWNMYYYFLDRNIEMLNMWAKNTMSHPMDSSEKEWKDTLLKIAKGFEEGIKFADHDTIAWDEKYKLMYERGLSGFALINDKRISEIDEEINFWERHNKEISEFEKSFNEAMKLFVDNFWQLWD